MKQIQGYKIRCKASRSPKGRLIGGIELRCIACGIEDGEEFDPAISLEQFKAIKDLRRCPICKDRYQVIPLPEPNKIPEKTGEPANKNEFIVQKYGPAEALIVNGLPFFVKVSNGEAILLEKIVLPEMTLRPLDKVSYLNKEYSFNSRAEINEYVERAKSESLDSLFHKVKTIWSKYIDADNDHLTICAADTIFTYFQDKFGMTHYLIFVGDNNTGKSNNLKVLQYLGYRPLFDTSITAANIHQFLGSVEEGQGIILEDEGDNIDEDIEKMKIYKVGYQSGTKVTRIQDVSGNRKQQSHWTYCFKAFSAERLPGNHKAKGFNERCFVIHCSTGKPTYDITEVINPAGDSKHSELLAELLDIRKLLLIYRLMHHNEPIPDIELSIKNRDKQLCKPLIRLFQNCSCREEIMTTLSKFIGEKRDRKNDSLDARLYTIITNLLGKEGTKLTNKQIWDAVMENIEGFETSKNTYQSEEFGEISKYKLKSILKDKFGAEPCHAGPEGKDRGLEFSQRTLNKLSYNYGEVEEIRIISDTSDTSDTFRECEGLKSDASTDASYNNNPAIIELDKHVKHEILDIDNSQGPNDTDTHSVKVSEPSEPSETVKVSCPNCNEVLDTDPYYRKFHNCEDGPVVNANLQYSHAVLVGHLQRL